MPSIQRKKEQMMEMLMSAGKATKVAANISNKSDPPIHPFSSPRRPSQLLGVISSIEACLILTRAITFPSFREVTLSFLVSTLSYIYPDPKPRPESESESEPKSDRARCADSGGLMWQVVCKQTALKIINFLFHSI